MSTRSVTRRAKRLICLLRGHDSVRRINSLRLRDTSPLGARFEVTDSNFYCGYCGKDPLS